MASKVPYQDLCPLKCNHS